jgi:hypothetical protein
MPFCIAPLRNHDVIISRKWFEYFKVNLAIADRKLLWLQSLPPMYFFDKLIEVSRKSMALQRADPRDQADTERRDRALDEESSQTSPVISSILSHTSATQAPAPKECKL